MQVHANKGGQMERESLKQPVLSAEPDVGLGPTTLR